MCEELVARQQEHQEGRPYVLLLAVDLGLDIDCDFIACDNGEVLKIV